MTECCAYWYTGQMHTVIIGGSRGIGWELAVLYAKQGVLVTVTGRKEPDQPEPGIIFRELSLSDADYIGKIKRLIAAEPHIDRFVYAPGYFQEGRVTDFSDAEIREMIQVCGSGFIFAARDILLKQHELAECVVITSTSQWTARELEPIYNFAKAGVAHFAASLSLDKRVGKLLTAGPAGTKTAFHAGRSSVDMSTYNDPAWVARQIYDHLQGDFDYKFIKLLRDPAKVEVAEVR